MNIPQEILAIGSNLSAKGYQAFLVGGCVRDLYLHKEPKDWDLASDATPQQMLEIFDHAHYDNDYGTVRVISDEATDQKLKVTEITTFRKEIGYSDDRRPDQVIFSTNLADDLSRRDFTINALAYPLSDSTSSRFDPKLVVDFHDGITDLEDKIVRTVNNPDERFNEDALRLMRAVRFAAQLDFAIDIDTLSSILKNASRLENIAVERIADEFNKLILTDSPLTGLELMRRTNLLKYVIPELLEGVDMDQNQAHSFTVWEHLIRTLQAAADKGHDLEMRLAALFHDIGKPRTKEVSGETNQPTFYNHEVAGAKMTKNILKRLKYSSHSVSQITTLVRWHMFFSDPDEITLSAVRRLIANVGPDMIWQLVDLRICDRIGTGRPKEEPYRLRKFQSMIEEASRQPTSVKQLQLDGNILINELHVKPGRIIGDVLHILLARVLDEPELNDKNILLDQAKELLNLSDTELSKLGAESKMSIKQVEAGKIKAIRDKYHVK